LGVHLYTVQNNNNEHDVTGGGHGTGQ
jgi:hypothetical protein